MSRALWIAVAIAGTLAAAALLWLAADQGDSGHTEQLVVPSAPGISAMPARLSSESGLPHSSAAAALARPNDAGTAQREWPLESPDRGPLNHWAIISDDGTTFQSGPAAILLGDIEKYQSALRNLTENADEDNLRRVTSVLQAEFAEDGAGASLYEMACDGQLCVGTMVLASEDVARQILRRIADNRDTNGIQRIMLDIGVNESNLGRFVLTTDPKVRMSLLRTGPDFRPPPPIQSAPDLRKRLDAESGTRILASPAK